MRLGNKERIVGRLYRRAGAGCHGEEVVQSKHTHDVTRETVSYSPKGSKAVSLQAMPVYFDLNNGLGDLGYGIPIVKTPGVKVAAHHVGKVLDCARYDYHEGDPAISGEPRFVASFFRGSHALSFICLHTTTLDYHYSRCGAGAGRRSSWRARRAAPSRWAPRSATPRRRSRWGGSRLAASPARPPGPPPSQLLSIDACPSMCFHQLQTHSLLGLLENPRIRR